MATFTPPSTNSVPPVLPQGSAGQTAGGYNLFRHFRARPEGVSVYILNDDTVTENDPDGTNVVWSINDRNGEAINAKYVKRAFYGGTENINISDAEATLLTGAGYSVS